MEEEPITARALVGFDPELPSRRSSTWVPITVELTNNDNDLKGNLLVTLKDGNVQYRTPIDLPTKTKKSYSLLVHIPAELDELEFYIESGRWRAPIETITVTAMTMEAFRFIAVISPERGSHDHMAHRPDDASDFFRRVIYTTPTVFPDYWVGYHNLDTILWDGGSNSEMSEEQEIALEKWIQMGGTLILAAGEHWQELNTSSFRNYVPMTMTGSRVLEPGTALESVGETVRPVLEDGLVITTGEVLDDPHVQVRMKAGENPFLIEREWGAGRIVFVASRLNQPLFSDSDHESIFKNFLTQALLPFPPDAINQLDTPITSFLRWISQAELPSTWFIAAYLGLYIIIVVPINYIVFRRFRRLEWAWFTVPIWAILFAYGAYYIGALRQQGQVSVNEISIIEARPQAHSAQTMSYCSIYSPVRQWYTLLFDQIPAFPQLPSIYDYRQGAEATSDESLRVFYARGGPVVEDYLIYHWSQRILKTLHESPLGEGVQVDMKWQASRIHGTITNNTGLNLMNPQLFVRDRMVQFYENLEDGKTVSIDETVNTMQMFDHERLARETYGMQIRSGGNTIQQGIATVDESLHQHYAAVLLSEPTSKNLAVLTARVSKPSFDFRLNGEMVKPNGETLFCLVFPLQQEFRGVKIVDSWHPASTAPAGWNRGMGGMYGMGGGYGMGGMGQGGEAVHFVQNKMSSTWDLVTDAPLMGGKLDWLTIEMDYKQINLFEPQQMGGRRPRGGGRVTSGASSFLYNQPTGRPPVEDYELHIQDRLSSEYKPLSAVVGPEGRITNPDRYVDKVSGTISFQLKAPPKFSIQFPYSSIDIQLQVDFGTGEGDTFLGYPL